LHCSTALLNIWTYFSNGLYKYRMRHLPCFCITKWQNISHNTRFVFYQHIQENAMCYSTHQYLIIWQLWKWIMQLIYSNYRTYFYRNSFPFHRFNSKNIYTKWKHNRNIMLNCWIEHRVTFNALILTYLTAIGLTPGGSRLTPGGSSI
jgi:hypothetical protein